MKKILNIIPLFLLVACQLISEPDISGSKVYLLAPVDNMETTLTNHTLWWEKVADAEKYNVVIVSPSWDSVKVLVADTNLSGNKFVIDLPTGHYDWGVRAYNSSSATDYYIRHFYIDTSSSLNSQKLALKSPEADLNINRKNILFEWDVLKHANSYIFDIRIDSWQGENYISQQITTYDTLTLNITEGVYAWGVKASNDFSSTAFTVRTLVVDLTAPEPPTITFPIATYPKVDTISQQEFKITWKRNGSSISVISVDTLWIATDSLFTKNVEIFPTPETEIKPVGYPSRFYFCKVNSSDKAGNVGKQSQYKKFFLDEK